MRSAPKFESATCEAKLVASVPPLVTVHVTSVIAKTVLSASASLVTIGFVTIGLVTIGLAAASLVTIGLVTIGFVTIGLVTIGLCVSVSVGDTLSAFVGSRRSVTLPVSAAGVSVAAQAGLSSVTGPFVHVTDNSATLTTTEATGSGEATVTGFVMLE